MYEDEILNLKACLPHLTEDVLEQALNAVDGDLTRAMNHLLDGTTVSIPSNPGRSLFLLNHYHSLYFLLSLFLFPIPSSSSLFTSFSSRHTVSATVQLAL